MTAMSNNKFVQENLFVASDISGPTTSRRCTDVLFLILFAIMLLSVNCIGFAAMGVINSPYIHKGNPLRLVRGMDYTGAICGVDGIVKSLENIWFPNAFGITPDSSGQYVPVNLAICVESCPNAGEARSDPYNLYGSWIAPTSTDNILGYCVPFDVSRAENFAESLFGDFIRASKVIALLGILLPVLCSFLFLVTIRIPGVLRFVVWLAIMIIQSILLVGSYFVLNKCQRDAQLTGAAAPSSQQIDAEKVLGIVLVLLTIGWASMICTMRERVALAISLVREAVKVLLAMSVLLFLPLFQSGLFVLVTVLWLVYSCYLMSSGTVNTDIDNITGDSIAVFTFDERASGALIFVFFGWIWTVRFLEALGQLISAHAILVWYFAVDRKLISSRQVCTSAGISICYHCGTAAFGSLLLALLDFIRTTIEYAKSKLNHRRSLLTKFVGCLLTCIIWLFEKCLEYLTSNAYIQCALVGSPFCTSAYRAFGLVLRNLGRVSTVVGVAGFVMFIGKISVALTAGGLSFWLLSNYKIGEISGVVGPSILITYVSYRTASFFLDVVSIASNTILQAYLVEEEMHNGSRWLGSLGSDGSSELKECVAALRDLSEDIHEDNLSLQGVQMTDVLSKDTAPESNIRGNDDWPSVDKSSCACPESQVIVEHRNSVNNPISSAQLSHSGGEYNPLGQNTTGPNAKGKPLRKFEWT